MNSIVFMKCITLVLFSLYSSIGWTAGDKQVAKAELVVNGKKLICKGSHKYRFWHCQGDFHGLLDFQPKNTEYPFLPMLYSISKAEINIKITEWIDENNLELLHGKVLEFSENDYLDINIGAILQDFMKQLSTDNDHKLLSYIFKTTTLLREFSSHLKKYKDTLKDLSITQIISCTNNVISSEFVIQNPNKAKPIDENIPCCGQDTFTKVENEYYRNLVNLEGKEATREELETIFQEILKRTDIPFDYSADGCYARAHVIANDLFERGYESGKVWLAGKLTDPSEPGRTWDYHVAAIIFATINNQRTMWVIDPSPTNNRLLSLDEWLAINHVKFMPKRIFYPIPSHHSLYEDKILCFSSPIPLWPYSCDMKESIEQSLLQAQKTNENNFKLLECQSKSTN